MGSGVWSCTLRRGGMSQASPSGICLHGGFQMGLCSHFNIEDGRKNNLFSILCFIISKKVKDVKMQLKHKRFLQCMEKMLWLIECAKSVLRNFVLEISHWTLLHGQVDQLKLIKLRHWKQSTLYHAGNSQHIQNIQIKCWKLFAQALLC